VNELRKLWIEGPAGRLEAVLRVACPARGAAVIAHPHPQFGGTLHNPVVFHADRELWRAGLTTLRFNFRGVGSSDGVYDEARGEVDDVGAAVSWLRGVAIGQPLVTVGYSFGSYCSLEWMLRDETVAGLVAVGLPLATWSFAALVELGRPVAVVQGSEDEYGSPALVQALLARRKGRSALSIIPGASHLFSDRAQEVGLAVAKAVDELLVSVRADADNTPG
jgi:uncharacterized protein